MTGLIAGVLAGAATYFILDSLRDSSPAKIPGVVRDIVDVPKMSAADAEQHRADRFREIHTIEDTLALPTDFVQTEALYVLAGRSDSAGVQDLIYQANRVASPSDRAAGLNILFLRLAEIDPESALAMARTEYFSDLSGVEQQVWHAWARMDLDAAIDAAKRDTSAAKNLAVQVFYSAYGYMGNKDTDYIEAELGIPPSRNIQAQYINTLARDNPRAAIEYISDMPGGQTRDQLIAVLGSILAKSMPNEAAGFAEFFASNRDRQVYTNAVGGTVVTQDPEQTLRALMSGPRTPQRRGQISSAINMLASTDLDKALLYYSEASPQDRQHMLFAVARELVQRDPAAAIEWARSNRSRSNQVDEFSTIVGLVAQFEPELALQAAETVKNLDERRNLLAQVVAQIAQDDRAMAINYLATIENKQEFNLLAMRIVPRWAVDEPQAALAWIASNDNVNAQQMYNIIGHQMVNYDVDLARRLLPGIPGDAANMWRRQIVQQLSSQGSIIEAKDFVRQFEDEDDYYQLQSVLISGLAQSDIYAARSMAEQLPDGEVRTQTLQNLVAMHAQQDPADAANWLNSLSDQQARQHAAAELARTWARQDPDSAEQWANRLPSGRIRDAAIGNMVSNWHETSPSRNALLRSMSDRAQRINAEMSYIYAVAGIDLQKARNMLVTSDLPAEHRDQVQGMLERIEQQGR